MDSIAKDKNQITLFYSSENSLGKQVQAYVESADKKVLGVDISKTKVTGTQWSEIAEGLGVDISDLVDRQHPDFKNEYGDSDINLDWNDWLKLLEKSPHILKYPVAIDGEDYIPLKTAASFKEHFTADSAGIEKPYKSWNLRLWDV